MSNLPWTANHSGDDVSCHHCLFSRNLAEGLRLGHCDESGNCTDVNGCARRAALVDEVRRGTCERSFNGRQCQLPGGHGGMHQQSTMRWSDGISDQALALR